MRGQAGFLIVVLVFVVVFGCGVSAALGAVVSAPGWAVDSIAAPSNFAPGVTSNYQIEVKNSGSVASRETDPVTGQPTPLVVEDVVPEGLTVLGASGAECSTVGQVVRCESPGVLQPESCVTPEQFCDVSSVLQIAIAVSVNEPVLAEKVTNHVTVSGGGAREVSASSTNTISAAPPAFGPANFNFFIDGLDGSRETQAGGHPYQLTTTIDLNSIVSQGKALESVITSVQDLKDVVVDLPLGFAGSTLAAPQCTLAQLSSEARCPRDTTVGHIKTEPIGEESANSPIWNLTPEHGVPAEFGFVDSKQNTHVFYAHVVPGPQGYVLQVTNFEIPQVILSHIVVTFYGDPALRDATGNAQIPFFTSPTACESGPLTATIYMDSWQHPASFNTDGTPNLGNANWVKATSTSPPVTGCNELEFLPEMFVQPTTHQADSPSGLEFELKLPQTENVGVHATPALKNATVTFPEGMTVDPSSGNGLGACSVAQIGWLGGSPFNFSPAPPQCPESSKIGSLELETPLIPGVLNGEIYLARQDENPFHSTFATYVIVDDPVTGVVLKIAGELKADEHTGRLTSFFPENAQLPFSDLRLHFFGGPRAELATPENCATYTTTSDLEPWSAPDSGPNGMPFDSFLINEGCVSGFAPAFTAGSTNLQAGAYTNFVASFSRQDTDQEMGGLTLTLPPGLLANVGSVPQCNEAQVNEAKDGSGGCPEASQVGTVTAGAGPGPNPLFVTGKAYLTGPYNGGAYGLAVIVPAIAGPFSFGNVVVRQSLRIDPRTAQATDVSDPFPTFLHPTGANGQTNGVPIKLRRIDVNINRENFTFNPTSCNKLQATGSLTSVANQTSALATPFQVTNCSTLKFTPKLTVTTAGKASKANGASLVFKIAYPNQPLGTQAWFNETKFVLPKQLPARLTTLQKACLASVFETNPAACPPASQIGHATVHTQILKDPLTGPVYFVSYGGAKFPEAVIVLQGDGVLINLHGETFISKAGITSATFRNIPDTPFENIQVTIPSGPYSEFGTNLPPKAKYNLCNQKLTMPTRFKASNGLQINQNTKITITGCKPKHRPKHKPKKHHAHNTTKH
jgi:hypothetical protein